MSWVLNICLSSLHRGDVSLVTLPTAVQKAQKRANGKLVTCSRVDVMIND